jgi:hypothetical protein
MTGLRQESDRQNNWPETAAILTCIWEVPGSHLRRNIDSFHSLLRPFLQTLQTIYGM